MRKYTVLRDLSRRSTGGPFGPRSTTRAEGIPSEPRVDVEELSNDDVQVLARDEEVRAIAPVMPTALIEPVPNAPGATAAQPTWGISAVGADTSTRTGAGVVVAVLDTGIDSAHEAFRSVSILEEDFSGSGNGDRKGHGTHCAGTVFGRDVGGTRIGVATGVQQALIGKVLGDDGRGDSDMIFRGIQWAVQNGAQVISMSLGFDFPGLVERQVGSGVPVDLATSVALEGYRANLRMFDSLMDMIRSSEVFSGGTLMIAAAGNESRRDEKPDHEVAAGLPAAADGVVSVGALAETAEGFTVAPFSNTFPVISGPGVGVISAKIGGGLRPLNGTSMATPHVAGLAALWWEEVRGSQLPATSTTVTAKLLANAATNGFAAKVDIADRGVGMAQAPQA